MTTLLNPPAPVKSRQPRQRVKPLRFLRYNPATGCLTIRVQTGAKVTETAYSVERIGSDWGDGFRLTKHVGDPRDEFDTYHVHLSDEGHTCDCKGHLQHGRCKHVSALVKLRELRQI